MFIYLEKENHRHYHAGLFGGFEVFDSCERIFYVTFWWLGLGWTHYEGSEWGGTSLQIYAIVSSGRMDAQGRPLATKDYRLCSLIKKSLCLRFISITPFFHMFRLKSFSRDAFSYLSLSRLAISLLIRIFISSQVSFSGSSSHWICSKILIISGVFGPGSFGYEYLFFIYSFTSDLISFMGSLVSWTSLLMIRLEVSFKEVSPSFV